MKKVKIGNEPIYDAGKLGVPRMLILGFQHMFAMFGATVLVPLLTGLDVSVTLLMAGLGTLLFHVFTKFKVPAFLGSSFAFLGGYAAVKAAYEQFGVASELEMLPYAGLGVVCAGLVYLILAALIKAIGVNRVMKYFPPVVTGPIIIAIGLTLSSSAINNCAACWPIALVALVTVIVFNIWGKGMAKIIPILLGVIISYCVCLIAGNLCGLEAATIDFSGVKEAAWIGFPVAWNETVFGGIDWKNTGAIIFGITTMTPIALATMMEHIGDISAISATCEKNFIEDPGLHRSLMGDGLATSLSALFGGPANTTYGENTGVLVLSKVYDPKVIRIAAYIAIVLSFCPKFAALISSIPTAIIGGISFVLYGMISAVGVRNMVEAKVDFSKSRNVIIAAVILVCAVGIKFSSAMGGDIVSSIDGAASFNIGSVAISLSGLAVAAIAGILLNAILPGKDFVFDSKQEYQALTVMGENAQYEEKSENK